jgi:hypothetical protein
MQRELVCTKDKNKINIKWTKSIIIFCVPLQPYCLTRNEISVRVNGKGLLYV